MVLDRSPEYAANYPYLVISATSDFIPDHSSIYGERFTDFLRRFYFRHLVQRVNFPYQCFDQKTNPECRATDITPCDRSWTGRLAYGCGGALPVPPRRPVTDPPRPVAPAARAQGGAEVRSAVCVVPSPPLA